jgi:hypothetical protein
MACRITYRVYRRESEHARKFLGIVAVRLDVADTDRRAFDMAKSLWGAGPWAYGSDYEIEVQGIE